MSIQMLFRTASVLTITLLLSAAAFAQESEKKYGKYVYPKCEVLGTENADVPGQIAQLKDKNVSVREKAARSLGTSCDQRAVEPLMAVLTDPEAKVRAAAVESLGRLGDRAAVTPLIEMAQEKEKDWSVRLVLGTSLATFQYHPAGYAALNSVANPQSDPVKSAEEMKARCNAILGINEMTDVRFSRKAILFLFRFLRETTDPQVKQVAEETLMKLSETRNGVHEIRAIFKQDTFPENRANAALWLGRHGVESARAMLTEASIGDGQPRVRQAAKEALAMLDKKQAAESKP